MTADEVMKLFDDMDLTPDPRSFLLVDVRRDDWEVRVQTYFSSVPMRFLIQILFSSPIITNGKLNKLIVNINDQQSILCSNVLDTADQKHTREVPSRRL